MPKINTTKEKAKLTIELHLVGSKWTDLVNKTQKLLISNLELKGFRKGHVPEKIALANISKERIWNSAMEELLNIHNNELVKIINDEKMITSPKVNVAKISDEEVLIKIEGAVNPDITLGDLSKLTTKFKFEAPTDEEYKKELENLSSLFSETKTIDDKTHSIKNNDIVTLSFNGKVDGKEFEGGKSENHDLTIGSKSFIDNFEDQLIGLKIGDKKVVKVKFPEVYPVKELAGKMADFDVEIKGIKIKQDLEGEKLSEKLKMFGYESKKDLENMIKKMFDDRKLDNSRTTFFNSIINEIQKLEGTKIELADEIIIEEAKQELIEFEKELSQQQTDLKSYLQMIKKTHDEFLQTDIKERAKNKLFGSLIYSKLLDHFKIKLVDEDFEKEYKKMSETQKNMTIEELKKQIPVEQLKNALTFNKLIDKLIK